MGALGRSGRGCHEPQAKPHALSLLALSPTHPLPRGQGVGVLPGHRDVGTAQGRLQHTPHSPCQGPWGKGEQVSGGLGTPRVPVAQGSTWGMLVPLPSCPPHTPGEVRMVSGCSLRRVFVILLTLPSWDPLGARHRVALGRASFG